MFHDSGDCSFEVISERLARLTVKRCPEPRALTLETEAQQHHFGLRRSPLYQLTQPHSPDDGWTVASLPSGAFVDRVSRVPAINALYSAWVVGSRATHGHEIVALLPVGRYLIVRSPRPILPATRVLLGNDMVPAGANMLVLREHDPYYACVIGPDSSRRPDLSQPLLSLIVLNYVGETWMHGALFFPFATPATFDAGPPGDVVLIVPQDGELVVDNLGSFSKDSERRAKQLWRDRQSSEFAAWCEETS